ncbi:MAG: membrane protein insertase YidC [Actinomycetota bacterium]
MDPFSFAPFAALLEGAYRLLDGLAALLQPIAGASSAASAILVVTMLVRLLLIPVGVSQVKAEGTRRRLHPQLLALQRRHSKDPSTLQKKTAALYRAENSSQFAGLLPALAQAPVLSVVYTLFIRTTIDGHANSLLSQQLFSAPLGGSFLQIVDLGGGGILVYLVLFAALAGIAGVQRRVTLRAQLIDPAAPASAATLARALSWMPFATMLFAAVVPLAAALYLAASAAWTLGERMLLRRRYWRGPERAAPPS